MPTLPAIGDDAEPFTLDDQFGTAHSISFGRGTPATVLVFADRGCVDTVRPWVEHLTDGRAPAVRVVGIAAVGTVPKLVRGAVRGLLKEQPPVLLDWGNRVSDRYGYEGGHCVLVVVDAAGRVRERVSGEYSEARLARVIAALGSRA